MDGGWILVNPFRCDPGGDDVEVFIEKDQISVSSKIEGSLAVVDPQRAGRMQTGRLQRFHLGTTYKAIG